MQTVTISAREVYDSIVRSVLDQPGYRHLKLPWTDFLETMRKSMEEWLLELLKRIFDQPMTSTPFTGGVSTAMVILGIVVLVALGITVAGLFSGMFRRTQAVHGILGETITEETTPDSLMEKGRIAEQSGDRRQAVRYGFIAVLLKMHRARMVFLDDAWTNQELYRHLEGSRFASLSSLKAVMEGFNAAWYGHKDLNGEVFAAWHGDLELVWQEVASREV